MIEAPTTTAIPTISNDRLNCKHAARRLRRRRGYSLLEVVMVIGIIAVVIAIILPGIESAREAARRAQCRNNLVQVTLAISTYESVYSVLPPGTICRTGPIVNLPEGYHVSWTVQILPFCDQQFFYNSIDDTEGVYGGWLAANTTQFPHMKCPASPLAFTNKTSSYAACYGDTETGIDADNNGSFFMNSSLNRRAIRDGTANTIFFGEKVVSESDLGWYSGTSSTLRNTATAPNNAMDRTMEYGSERNGGFGSNHKNGAIFSFGDGSVRLIRNEVDADVFQRLGNRHDGELLDTSSF